MFDEDELFSDEDMKLIKETFDYRIKWLTKYIDKHDKFGGAEEAKTKRSELYELRHRIRMNS
jgi:hypothetical protein